MVRCAFVSINGGVTASDARLKNIIGQSNSAKDLETLKRIVVTDYTMKDVVQYGGKRLKKVIAQQVEQVYPTAVVTTGIKGFTFTPDIYAPADSVKLEKSDVYTIKLTKAHGLKEGDVVRLITPKKPELNVTVHPIDWQTFTVNTKEPLGDKVFVYGKQCTDLKAVDYDAISMLNVSATQELAKRVEEQAAEIEDLKAVNQKLTAVESENTELKAEMESLKKAVATMEQKQKSGVRTVALEQ